MSDRDNFDWLSWLVGWNRRLHEIHNEHGDPGASVPPESGVGSCSSESLAASVESPRSGVPTSIAAAEIADHYRDMAQALEIAREALIESIDIEDRSPDGTCDRGMLDRELCRALNALDSAHAIVTKRQLAHELSL